MLSGAGADQLYGGVGADVFDGGAGNDSLYGERGDDLLDGGAGSDTIHGGGGNDWVVYATATSPVTVDMRRSAPQSSGGGGVDTLYEIENVIGSMFGDRILADITVANTLAGGQGNATYAIYESIDTVVEKPGEGTTDRIYAYSNISLDPTRDVEMIFARVDTGLVLTGSAIANRIEGAAGDDTISGDAGDDKLRGAAGLDLIDGDDGDDTLFGGAGNDTLRGGAGFDSLDGDDGGDRIIEYAGEGIDSVWASIDFAVGAGQEVERLYVATATGIELIANEFANRLYGNSGTAIRAMTRSSAAGVTTPSRATTATIV